ncbi:calvin cycle protein CP12-3, chloroplastic-like [Malania oleifera]|uniref:calvin cycle protein CP12-3, chloroplastic-like n=1 Tax=Malania oleifera TaxID=397392 RepID=UPI0025AEA15C|nr:calvin cycle protein CP12-3, chloroplastic-like [Malania oleifera]
MASLPVLNLKIPCSPSCSSRSDAFTGDIMISSSKARMFSGAGKGRRGGEKVVCTSVKFKGTQMREKRLTEMIEEKVMEAKEVCEGNESSDECKVAWDEVEEVSQAKANLRRKIMDKEDPLESFCQENPETDECRIYED